MRWGEVHGVHGNHVWVVEARVHLCTLCAAVSSTLTRTVISRCRLSSRAGATGRRSSLRATCLPVRVSTHSHTLPLAPLPSRRTGWYCGGSCQSLRDVVDAGRGIGRPCLNRLLNEEDMALSEDAMSSLACVGGLCCSLSIVLWCCVDCEHKHNFDDRLL